MPRLSNSWCFGAMTLVFISSTIDATETYNDPTVSSVAASNQQFPAQDSLKHSGKQHALDPASNNPTVSSVAASNQQFPAQDSLQHNKTTVEK